MGRKKLLFGLAVILVFLITLFFSVGREKEQPLPEISSPEVVPVETASRIGTSVEGRAITAYTYGTGNTELLFVGGIHGGYEWNSVLLAYRFMDYLKEHPEKIPENLTVTVIPSANPDGLFEVIGKEGRFSIADIPTVPNTTGTGRFNANGVDLNRNFDCKWKPTSSWRGETVSAGTGPFSEPEALALKNWVLANKPAVATFWHSQGNTVYGSECTEGILPQTTALLRAYASASGYAEMPLFTSYEISGDAEGWLASIGIPAITVELKTHETVEWEENLRGIEALFTYFSTWAE